MRAKDEDGKLLPPPHQRLENAPALISAAYMSLAKDGRSTIWTAAQKVSICNKVVDHVFDGDAIPKRFFKPDNDRPENHALSEMFKAAANAVRAVRAA